MRPAAVFMRALYGMLGSATGACSAVLPQRLHPGKRAYRVIAELGLAPGRIQFSAEVLASLVRCRVIQNHLIRLSAENLRGFARHRIRYQGEITPAVLLNQHRPLIFATPHYGVPLAALVAGSHLLHGKRALNIFYDKARHEAQLRCFFERAGANPTRLLGGQGGVRSALRALARAECVAILPDAFADIATTVVVPFFTRLLRIASGTAFLARRSNALIVPVFAMPAVKFGVRIHLGTPIDPQRLSHEDEAQAIFILSHLLFNRIEEQLRFEPEHWRCWETLPLVSTPLRTQADLNDFRLLRAVESRLYALPPALQDIPELELLLR